MQKLYLNDPYIKDFKANITHVEEKEGKALVVLDSTAFYPEGGGQPSDTGAIGGINVSYVYEEDGIVYHVMDSKPSKMSGVDCRIDWDRRFDHMQQHCGQHILSAAFDKLLDGTTVGFHLGNEYVTVDIALGSLSAEDACKVEDMANEMVFKNVPVRYHYPEGDEVSKFPLRKPPSVEEDIRIVEVDGFDFSPCGGTHPERAGEVGTIKIRKWEKSKDSIRVEFVCGKRALVDFRWKNEYINSISSLLSSKDTDILENVKKSIEDLHASSKQVKLLKDRVLTYEAAEFWGSADEINGVRIVRVVFEGRDFKEITSLAGKIAKHPSVIALLGLKSDSARMVFTRSLDLNIKINELFREVLPLINGKGGGSPMSAQGGGTDISNLESAIESAYIILKNRHLK